MVATHYPMWRQSFHLDGRTPDWEPAPGVKLPTWATASGVDDDSLAVADL